MSGVVRFYWVDPPAKATPTSKADEADRVAWRDDNGADVTWWLGPRSLFPEEEAKDLPRVTCSREEFGAALARLADALERRRGVPQGAP